MKKQQSIKVMKEVWKNEDGERKGEEKGRSDVGGWCYTIL